jgi:hypothetical protein
MESQLAGRNALGSARLVDECLGQFARLTVGNHPADDEAGEYVEYDVEVQVLALDESLELGVSRPGHFSPGPSQNRT